MRWRILNNNSSYVHQIHKELRNKRRRNELYLYSIQVVIPAKNALSQRRYLQGITVLIVLRLTSTSVLQRVGTPVQKSQNSWPVDVGWCRLMSVVSVSLRNLSLSPPLDEILRLGLRAGPGSWNCQMDQNHDITWYIYIYIYIYIFLYIYIYTHIATS